MNTAYDIGATIMRAIDRISQGDTPTKACRAEGVAVQTMQRWLKANPELAALYEEAEQVGHDTLADTLLDLNELSAITNANGEKELKIAAENVKWYLARRNRRYNERVVVEHNHTADKAVIEALNKGKQRAFDKLTGPVEDAQYTVVEDDPIAEFR